MKVEDKLIIYKTHKVDKNRYSAKRPKRRISLNVSRSKDKYNLKGNTKNPLIDYDWIMHERSVVRNHPIYKETDSFPDSAAV